MRSVLVVTDKGLHILHLSVIVFCVIGWMIPYTRVANLYLIILIALSWFVPGIFFGYGYCLITEVQWKIKRYLGQNQLPTSFIKYQLDKLTGKDSNPKTVSIITQVVFYSSAIASVYVNLL